MIRRILAFCSALLIAATAAAAIGNAQPKTRDELVIGMTQYPTTLHPSIESMLAKTYVLDMTRRPFTAYDKDWKLICMLCTELPSIENGKAVPEDLPDGRKGIAVTYTIQPEAKWGDGTPVTTKDVLFTHEVGRHPQSGVANSELYRRIGKIDVKDDKTFTLHINKLTFDYAAINDFFVLPEHVERARFADPPNYRGRNGYDTDTANPALYFGPYRITEKAVGSHIVLERNPTWWGKEPYFRRIVFRIIENTAALEANLLSGSIDYIAGEGLGLNLDQALTFEKRHGARYDVLYKESLVYEHVELNLDNPILKDNRVRQALLYGLNREVMNQQLFGGRQPVANTSIHPLDQGYDPNVKHYEYDPKKAAALLDEAGWTLKGKGTRVNAKGEPLVLELMTTAGNKSREQVQQVLQSQWRQLGVDIRIRNEPARVFFGETVTKRKFSAMAMFAWFSSPENVPRTTLQSEEIPTAQNNYVGQNYTGYSNPEVDKLIDAIEIELDHDKRMALWSKLERIYAEDLPSLPLYFRADPFIFPKWLKGIEPTGHQDISTLWVENWHVAP